MEDQFKNIAALIGDPVRATIMWTLLDGRALTATELALAADTTAQNASMHLAKLVKADLLAVESQGRHRYYRFARKDIAYAIEAMANLLPPVPGRTTNGSHTAKNDQSAVMYCRSCYDHLAGTVGVAFTNSLLQDGLILERAGTWELGPRGEKKCEELGVDVASLKNLRRSFLRPCLDWSERRHHMAGSLAAALLEHMIGADWLRRVKHSRAIIVTAKGQGEFYKHFKLNIT